MLRSLPVATLPLAAALGLSAHAATYVGPGGPIPDAPDLSGPPGEISTEVLVPDNIVPETLSVTISGLTHSWCGDIIIFLTHVPSGVSQDLVRRIGVPVNPPANVFGDSSNYGGNYTFVDGGADIWVAAGQGGTNFVIPPGSYRPSTAGTGLPVPLLGAFAGINASGTWRLTIQDAAAGDAGAFVSWTLHLTGSPPPLCPTDESCFQPHESPGCNEALCCDAVCAVDASCCEIQWDEGCVLQAIASCTGCGGSGSGDCCTPHGGSACENQACCEAICTVDPACCEGAWDAICVEQARLLPVCACPVCPAEGSCFEAHGSPGCELEDCCEAVCALRPTCCEVAWDLECAAEASVSCTTCGRPDAGLCCAPHPGPGCAEESCCLAVCALDLACCLSAWDLACVQQATNLPVCGCTSTCSPTPTCCFTAHGEPGCKDADCCDLVCASDPFCCLLAWDKSCAGQAILTCCPADLNADGLIDGADLGLMLNSLYTPTAPGDPSDLDCSNAVDAADLGLLLSAWGEC